MIAALRTQIMKRALYVLVASLSAIWMTTACGPTISSGSHVDHTVSFAHYRTFDWGPSDALPTGDPRLDGDPFFKDHVQGAVERALAGRGIGLVSAGPPDLLIHYHASVTERMDVNKADRAYAVCGSLDCRPEVVWYEAGTLILDVMDARSNTLVWRGWAQNNVDEMLANQDAMAKIVDRAVTAIVAQLPRR
jgi:hypothetical protein